MPENCFDDPKVMWEICRNHIVHENELLDHRLSWLLAIQGLAFAVFVGLFAVEYEPYVVLVLVTATAAVSIAATKLLHPFITQAIRAHDSWKIRWETYTNKLPHVVGLDERNDDTGSLICWLNCFSWLLLRDKNGHVDGNHPVQRLMESIVTLWCILCAAGWLMVFIRHRNGHVANALKRKLVEDPQSIAVLLVLAFLMGIAATLFVIGVLFCMTRKKSG